VLVLGFLIILPIPSFVEPFLDSFPFIFGEYDASPFHLGILLIYLPLLLLFLSACPSFFIRVDISRVGPGTMDQLFMILLLDDSQSETNCESPVRPP